MSSRSNQDEEELCKILQDVQKSIALAVDLAKNPRETLVKENGGESNILSEYYSHLKNQSNLAAKNQMESEINIQELQREIKLVREENAKMRNVNLTLKRKIIDFEKSDQFKAHQMLIINAKNLTKSNKKLECEKNQQTKHITAIHSKMLTLNLQIQKMKQEIFKIKRDIKKKKKKKNCVPALEPVKSENISPEDYDFEHEKVKIEEIEIKTEY